MKRKNSRFHSPEGAPCQQIGSYHHARPVSLSLSLRNHYRSMNIRITPFLPNPHQSVFCESPENPLEIHQPVFLCEQGLCRALRLTFCQFRRRCRGDRSGRPVQCTSNKHPPYIVVLSFCILVILKSLNCKIPNCIILDWTGRPDRSPLHFVYWTYMPEGTLSIDRHFFFLQLIPEFKIMVIFVKRITDI